MAKKIKTSGSLVYVLWLPVIICILVTFHNEIISKIINKNSQSSLGGKLLVYEDISNKKVK